MVAKFKAKNDLASLHKMNVEETWTNVISYSEYEYQMWLSWKTLNRLKAFFAASHSPLDDLIGKHLIRVWATKREQQQQFQKQKVFIKIVGDISSLYKKI